jgi:hypothetical protein
MMALFYALDLSIIHKREDDEEFVRKLPILDDHTFFNDVMQELLINEDLPDINESLKWQCPGLRALAIFTLGELKPKFFKEIKYNF